MDMRKLLQLVVEKDASDMHLKVGSVPILRLNRSLVPQKKLDTISRETMLTIIDSLTNEGQKNEFLEKNEVDYAYIAKDIGRFRVNIFRQRGECGIVLRRVKEVIPTFEELNLPGLFKKIASGERGIVLITGASSSGKTTTMASMINYINMHENKHILTLENPIEYIHKDIKSVINQREIGVDTESFHEALKHIIRQDPDVIAIGEMREREGVTVSISAAETGHLVLSSFHAEDTVQAIRRLLDFFDNSEKNHIRAQLANNLNAITCQRLLKVAKTNDKAKCDLVPATEILSVTPIVSKLIRNNKLENIYKVLQSGESGMQSFNNSLLDLYRKKVITREEAISNSSNPEAIKINLKGIYLDEDKAILG